MAAQRTRIEGYLSANDHIKHRALRRTMLAVCLELDVIDPQTGCWILNNPGVQRIRNRHGNFSLHQRGGAATYYCCRNVTAPGNSDQLLIHHVSTVALEDDADIRFVTQPALNLECSHLCSNPLCWNPFHIVSEDRNTNITRRGCPGKIWADGLNGATVLVHDCPHGPDQCIGVQNVQTAARDAFHQTRLSNSLLDLEAVIIRLAGTLNLDPRAISPDLTNWRLNNNVGILPIPNTINNGWFNGF